jgi:hypothetical protein
MHFFFIHAWSIFKKNVLWDNINLLLERNIDIGTICMNTFFKGKPNVIRKQIKNFKLPKLSQWSHHGTIQGVHG